ncbi:hypothetical protein [Oryzifoliimicrobium ureilyticus]|uniref:hypothetical protein n=1 Tax=Oryzifoliimicrobium ureilyticus TaxID=3113724 RepID=UPI0030767477
MDTEMTISEIVSDPMIGLVLKADNVPPAAFAQLLESAARLRRIQLEVATSGRKSAIKKSEPEFA